MRGNLREAVLCSESRPCSV